MGEADFGRRAEDKGQPSTREILIRIDERLSNLINRYDAHEKEDKQEFIDHDKRLGSLENDRAKVWAGAATLSFIIAIIMKIFKHD